MNESGCVKHAVCCEKSLADGSRPRSRQVSELREHHIFHVVGIVGLSDDQPVGTIALPVRGVASYASDLSVQTTSQ